MIGLGNRNEDLGELDRLNQKWRVPCRDRIHFFDRGCRVHLFLHLGTYDNIVECGDVISLHRSEARRRELHRFGHGTQWLVEKLEMSFDG